MRLHSLLPFILAGLASCHARTMPSPAAGCNVVVTEHEARIVFPAVDRTTWTWNRATGARPNYWWSVYLVAPGVHLEVGRGATGGERRSDLVTMIQAATVAITWPSSGRGEFDQYRTVPGLHGEVIAARPALVIRDSALLHELFTLNHPQFADCRFSSAERDEGTMLVDTVHYVGSRAPPA